MIVFPHAKINLGLNVVRRRTDGFHEIESVMLPIPLHDMLEAVVDHEVPRGEVVFTRSGTVLPGKPEDDLCWRAAMGVMEGRDVPGIRLHLHKIIPVGGGLGGGSSDAAHVLLMLGELLDLRLTEHALHERAAALGSDVPFFLNRQPQLAQGRGEVLSPLEVPLTGTWLLLVNPGVAVGTAEVYRHCEPTGSATDIAAILISHALEAWQGQVVNSLETYVFRKYPAVERAWEKIRDAGAVYYAMSGSGSTVYGLFRRRPPELEWPTDHTVRVIRL